MGGLWGSAPDTTNPDEEDVLVLRGADFRNWDSRRAADAAPRRVASRSLPRRLLRPGDLVLEVSGGSPAQPVGRVLAIDDQAVDGADKPLITSNFCRKLRLKDGVDPFFVKRQLDWLYGSGHTERFQTSTTNIRNLQVDDFLQGTSIVLPDHALQVQVTALLDRVDGKRAGCSTHIAAARRSVERFRQAVVATACSGPLTADWRLSMGRKDDSDRPAGWTEASVASLAADVPRAIQSGPFGSNLKHSEFQTTGRLVIGIDNVLDGQFVLGSQHRISEAKFAELRKYEARPLDVLITVMATVGRVCVVPRDIEPSIITKHVYRITVDQDRVLPSFLMNALRGHSKVREQIHTQTRGQTRPGINGQIVKDLVILVPPVDEQREIVGRIDQLLALADGLGQRIELASARVDRSSQAVLAKAFRGELQI